MMSLSRRARCTQMSQTELGAKPHGKRPLSKASLPPPDATSDQRREFDEWWKSSPHAKRYQELGRIVQQLPKKEIVADIGCFGGLLLPYLRSAGCIRVEGFDKDPDSIEIAAKVYDSVHSWDVERDPAPVGPETYDVVVAAEIIEHFLDVDHFLEECWRITRRAGFVLITTPNLTSLLNRFRVALGFMPFNAPSVSWRYFSDSVDPAHVKIATAGEWIRAFQGHRFQVTGVRGLSKYWFTRAVDLLRPTLSGTLIFTLKKAIIPDVD